MMGCTEQTELCPATQASWLLNFQVTSQPNRSERHIVVVSGLYGHEKEGSNREEDTK